MLKLNKKAFTVMKAFLVNYLNVNQNYDLKSNFN